MTVEEKVGKIIDILLARTEAGKVPWEAPDNYYVAYSLPDSAVEIHSSFDPEERADEWYTVKLFDDAGAQIASFEDHQIQRCNELESLFRMARRQALRVDTKLDALLHRLERAS